MPLLGSVAVTATGCDFSCKSGYVKDASARECNFPSLGNYADNGVEKVCSPITGDSGGFDAFAANTGAVSAADGCGFSCNAGYVKDSSGRECNYPNQGTYVNASGAEVGCTDISGILGFGTWDSGAATTAITCPFSCSSGYTISGRMCNKAIPQMLALGQDTSHVLFDNGEVEAWGKVSNRKWRTHIKEDLGSHTPQALVSGHDHQCIILKNAALNHGSLMCWGNNGDEQLGVGDTIKKTTPTAVTVLGNDGNGDPYTVKSVTGGGSHTCAILNDDTVKCWGDNDNGQIGGGSSGANKTISGTTGDPLSGNARRIAAGLAHTCAILSDKSVKCWGFNFNGQTDGGSPSLGAGKTATKIAVGSGSSCAILNDATVKCWGFLGSPILEVGKAATEIVAGGTHACALLNDKTVYCWGASNAYGQIGGGSATPDRVLRGTTVGEPLGRQTATQIAAGDYHTCAIMNSDNSVKCWGSNANSDSFYGQIVGGVAMTGGTNGTGTSTGETATLTATSAPTATSLDSDEDGQICKITLSGGNLRSSVIVRDMTIGLLTYNSASSTDVSTAIDNLITAIGSPMNIAGTNVTLSKSGTDKIAATTDTAVFEGMTLAIQHANSSGDCTSPVATEISLSGASGGDEAEGLWVISNDYTGSGDKTVNLDSVHIDLGNSNLTKEAIADKIIAEVTGGSWAGKQNVDLPYTATKVQNSDNSDCPVGDYCVLFSRLFKGTEGNYGIPFGDRDYEH